MRRALVLLSLLLCTRVQGQTTRSPSFSKHLIHPNKDLVIGFSPGERVTFAYALCDRSEKRRRCELTLETITWEGASRKKSCSLRVSVGKDHGDRKYMLTRFGEEDLVFVWKQGDVGRRHRLSPRDVGYHREYLRVRVVHMSSCSFNEVKIVGDRSRAYYSDDINIENVNVVPYEDGTFDVFYRNVKSCGRDRRCKMTYDSKYQEFSVAVGPYPSLPIDCDSVAEVYPISGLDEQVEAYVVKSEFMSDGTVKLLNASGAVLYNHEYSYNIMEVPKRISHIAISHAQRTLGICQQGMFMTELDCSLFTPQGNGTLGITVSLRHSDVRILRMLNLYDGGFLIMIGYGQKEVKKALRVLDVVKFDSYGQLVEAYGSTDLECPVNESVLDVDFFLKDGYDYCYYVACNWPRSEDQQRDEYHLKIYNECYPDERSSEERW